MAFIMKLLLAICTGVYVFALTFTFRFANRTNQLTVCQKIAFQAHSEIRNILKVFIILFWGAKGPFLALTAAKAFFAAPVWKFARFLYP